MLHTKFRGNRPAGSGEDFNGFLPYMGVAAILVIWPVKLGFTGVYIFFLFLLQNIDCGYSLEPPR